MLMTKSIHISDLTFEDTKDSNGAVGTFEGYASTWGNVDLDDDVIEKGAFGNPVASKVKLLWSHQRDEIIGAWTSIKNDDKGLKVKGSLNLEVQRGREAYALLKQGALSDMSVGFRTLKSGLKPVKDGAKERLVRIIQEAWLGEISLVGIPANPLAVVTGVKSIKDGQLPTLTEFKEGLRDAGYSDEQANIIVTKGFGALVGSGSSGETANTVSLAELLGEAIAAF